jgi:hypothetical protein
MTEHNWLCLDDPDNWQELLGVTEAELNDPHNELRLLDFDQHDAPWEEETIWWKEQDDDLQAQELAAIESQAAIEDIRINGYE